MFDTLDLKIRQMHAALADTATSDLSAIRPQIRYSAGCVSVMVDYSQDSDRVALANAASLLVANIASIKDHLKVWCKKQHVLFQGETLINTNRAVAIVHDLWNTDKHAELNSAPRSGHKPRLKDVRTALRLSGGAGGSAACQFDARTGQHTTSTSGGGSIRLSLVAEVVDEAGNMLGDFTEICTQAVEAWSNALSTAGVPLP